MEKEGIIVAVDFDGTVVTHEYPIVGKDIGAVPVLKRLVEEGHKLMLWTMRGTTHFGTLSDAFNWFKDNDIPLWSVNRNIEQDTWTDSKKQYANLYIDDAALGAPLKFDKDICDRPFIDWVMVEKMLEDMNILTQNTKK